MERPISSGHGLGNLDFLDSVVCGHALVAAMDDHVTDLYNSVTGSDGDCTGLFRSVIDSEYTSWDSEEKVSETQF